jgi:hypothetical protein
MTNDKRATEEMQKCLDCYKERLRILFKAQSADLTTTLRDVHSRNVIDPENEDSEFHSDFTRVINDAQLQHADKAYTREAEVTSDPFVGMDMAMLKGTDGELLHATIRKCVRDQDGMPV